MATSPIDPTMQIPSPELVKRIESLVSSLLGVTRSHVERDESGAIRSLYASVAPGHSPDRVRREIRSALLSSLDLELAPDVVDVEVEEQLGRRQEQFWQVPDREADVASEERADQRRASESPGEERPEERPARAEGMEPPEQTGPEGWLSRADAPSRRTGDLDRAAERWPAEDRRSPGDRRAEEERRTPEDRRAEEDRRSGEPASVEDTEIPSAAYIDAIIDRLRAREREHGGVYPSAAGEEVGAAPTEAPVGPGRQTSPGPSVREEELVRPEEEVPGPEDFPRPERRADADPSHATEASPGSESSAHAEVSGRGEPPTPGVVSEPSAAPDAQRAGGLLPLSLGEYVLLGGGGGDRGVELRIRVEAGGGRFIGTVHVPSLEDVSPGLFVGATLRAVERALDARPVSQRSARILILEAVDMEEVVLREGRFVTATVQAVHRDGESRATGLVPAEGRIVREAAAEAALDAVSRILQGRHTRKVEGSDRIRRDGGGVPGRSGSATSRAEGPGGRGAASGSGTAGSSGETGRARTSSGGRGSRTGEGDRGFTRDPFNIWE